MNSASDAVPFPPPPFSPSSTPPLSSPPVPHHHHIPPEQQHSHCQRQPPPHHSPLDSPQPSAIQLPPSKRKAPDSPAQQHPQKHPRGDDRRTSINMTVDTVMEPRHLDDGRNHNDSNHAAADSNHTVDTDMDRQPDDGGSSSRGAPNGNRNRNSNKKNSDKVGGVAGARSDDKGSDGGDDAGDDDADDDDADDAEDDDDDHDADADAIRPPIKDKSSLVLLETSQESPDWQRTIGKVVRNVVSVRFTLPCAFDTSTAMSGEATGFIIDAERGYVLTNRHIVNPGPFWGYIVLDNHEEVDAHPVYRDPIHDFGILRFDPKAIKYMKIDGLEMRPDLAKVGTEIRVVGNDAGEKLCILQGVIGRLDRNAPEYEGYCDFNTCYYQANASGSDGSSGSPVVDKDGNAIALQAGGRTDGASTDYFLPLDRPLRVLQCLRESKPILRGDIQCQFLLKPFDECRRLGLTAEWEATIRAAFPDATNMLVAEIVLPLGPSHEKIEEGDVLLKINGELLLHFIRFDEILDSSVGQKVSVLLQRGGKDLEVEIEVGDLHKITPDRFVTVAGGTFQNLSYQQARTWAIACQGVLVCESGGSWRVDTESGLLIQSVDQKKTPDLDSFVQVMRAIPDKARVVITYKLLRDLHTLHTTIIRVDRHWSSKMKLAVRNDVTGLWDFSVLSDALAAVPPERRSASFVEVENAPIPAIADLARCFVHVEAYMPVKLDGFPKNRRWGMGLVIDAEKGLVVVSRAVVPFDLCDITVTVADSVMVDGRVIFLHPLQNYTVIQYDPALVDAPVLSATLSDRTLTQGAPVYFVGFSRPGRIVHTATTVTEITTVAIPANVTSPRYRALNVDAITIDTPQGQTCGSGVLVSTDGTIQALWLTYLGDRSSGSHHDDEYHLGLATQSLLPVVNDIRAGIVPKLRILSVEFRAIPMSQARVMGVPEDWIRRVAEANKALHQLFMVGKLAFERGGRHGALKEGDILLTLNGRMVSKVSDLDIMYREEVLDALIVRDTEILEIKAPTVAADDVETNYAISFCGALIHQPHHAVRQQISKLHSEVYISARTRGSPAMQYCLAPTNFITHVNSKPTPDMKAFLAAVQDIPDNTYFRLRAVSFDSVPWVVTMKKNEHYFPTVEWIKDPAEPNGWRRITHEGTKLILGEGVDGVSPTAMCDTSALDCAYC